MPAGLNYRHLHHFWIVAQEGSLAGASRRLGVQHSTLSSQLRSLEAALGGRLLLRRPRGVRLTPRGEVVRGYCDQIFRLGGELLEAAQAQAPAPGRLYLGMLPSVSRSLLHETLRPPLSAEAATRLEVAVGDAGTLCGELIAGRLHAVITDRLPLRAAHGDIHAHLIGQSRIGLYGTRRLAERYRPGYPDSLDGAPLLLPAAGSLREALASWFAEEGIRPRIAAEIDDVPLLKGLAARGQGLAPIGRWLGEDARRRFGLMQVGLVPGVFARLYVLTLGRRVRHPAVQQLIDRGRDRLGGR
ncbi:Transcriptional activator protein NhaR [Gammaproteobacteria bacterium]|nr:Transcriptional activator protein NhaR [Gammaproteobacteria bacterium]